jgi:hypothetical protein
LAEGRCPLCGHRKGKRHCPAKNAVICQTCCGEKRLVEIQCPDDCPYLTGSHAPAWDGRETERRRDLRTLGPHARELSEDESQLFFASLICLHERDSKGAGLTDAKVRRALETLEGTARTRSHGLIYEHPAEDVEAQAIASELTAFWKRLTEKDPFETKELTKVLTALLGAVVDAEKAAAGPRTFLEMVERLVRRQGLKLGRSESEGRLIVP